MIFRLAQEILDQYSLSSIHWQASKVVNIRIRYYLVVENDRGLMRTGVWLHVQVLYTFETLNSTISVSVYVYN